MKREEAYNELNILNLSELLMADMEKHRPQNFGGDEVDLLKLLNCQINLDEKIRSEILEELHLNSVEDAQELIAKASDTVGIQHFVNEAYALAENRKISIIKHNRYSLGAFHDHEFFELAYLFHGSCRHTFLIPEGTQPGFTGEGTKNSEEKIKGKAKVAAQKITGARKRGSDISSMEREEITILGSGELVIIPPGMVHKVMTEGDSLMVNILIHRQTFQSAFLAQLPENNTLYHFFSEALLSEKKSSYILVRHGSGHLADLILDMYIEEKNRDGYSDRMQEKLLQMFFLELLRSNEKTMSLSANVSEKDRLIAEILLYIENNYRNISLADVAEQFHFSRTYLNRIFKEKTQKTVLQMIKELRLSEASKLLKDRTLSVANIGEMVGYTDTSYFIEEYRKMYGTTPYVTRKNS